MQKLPVPPLDQTIQKYLRSIHPFLSEQNYQRSLKLSQDFEQGIGKVLQQRLIQRAEQKDNWLYDWWLEHSYMKYRESLALNVSFFFVFEDIQRSQVEVAAIVAFYAARFKAELPSMPVDKIRGVEQCMSQYQHMFNSCRLPCPVEDGFYKGSAEYFGLMYRNGFYFVPENGTVGQLVATIGDIVSSGQLYEPVAGLSAADRDTWAKVYPQLKKSNQQLIAKIQNCSFMVCLDDSLPLVREELAHLCWHNYGQNRWFDKTLQFIVFGNGRAGFIGEHSMQDATTPSRLCDFILENARKPSVVLSEKLSYESGALVLPTSLSATLPKVLGELNKQVHQHDVQIINYQRYGKGLIKKLGMSPDSFVQMAIQYGYYLMNGNNCATYESAGMKRYLKGRTETCRSVTEESVAFCHSESDGISQVQRAEMFRTAVKSHSSYMSDCLNGQGIDRHFLGLRLSLKDNEPLPDFFKDPAYNLSCHWQLSTSQIPSDHFSGYGWGEVVPDGYGVAYMVREDCLMFNIAGLVGDTVPDITGQPPYFTQHYKQMRVKWLRGSIEEALDRLYTLFTEEPTPEVQQTTPSRSVERAQSIRSVTSLLQFGLSLAYPKRSAPTSRQDSQEEELSGVMTDDLGLIDWGTRRRSEGNRLFHLLRDLVMTSSDASDKK